MDGRRVLVQCTTTLLCQSRTPQQPEVQRQSTFAHHPGEQPKSSSTAAEDWLMLHLESGRIVRHGVVVRALLCCDPPPRGGGGGAYFCAVQRGGDQGDQQQPEANQVSATEKEGGGGGSSWRRRWIDETAEEANRPLGGNLCTARALRATFRLCSPQRAPKHTPWKSP